jgi:hypothetical protein
MKTVLLKNPQTYQSSTQDLYKQMAASSTPLREGLIALAFLIAGIFYPLALIGVPLSAVEALGGYQRNRARGLSHWQSIVQPGALDVESLDSIPASLRSHEYGHQLTGFGEFGNFFVKHIVALAAIVTQIVLGLRQLILWAIHGGRVIQLNAEQSRLSLGLAKLAAVSPIQLVNTVSHAAVEAFKSDAAKQEEIRRQHAQMVAEEEQHGAA